MAAIATVVVAVAMAANEAGRVAVSAAAGVGRDYGRRRRTTMARRRNRG